MDTNSGLANDKLLLNQVQQGNKHAFNVLYEKYWDQAFSNAYKRLKDADQAKDIVQEIFVSIWLRRENEIENLPAYLNVAVRNRVFKLTEKQKLTSPFLDRVNEIPDMYKQADTKLEYREFYRAYEALLATLPPKRQQIFRLRFHEDFGTNDIAHQMGISRKTVQNQLGKAVEYLKVVLLPSILLIVNATC